MKNKEIILHLSLIDGIGPVTIKKLVQEKPKDFVLSNLYNLMVSDVTQLFSFSQKAAQKIVIGLRDKTDLNKELLLIEKYKIQWTAFGFKDYPSLLSEIYAPPPILYWQGSLCGNEEKTIAIIGSRKAHRYAEQTIKKFVPLLVNQQWTIVSGGAIGADSMAHYQTVQVGGKTVVVLGSGLLRPYPRSNQKLFQSILQTGGALVSSFPLETQAMPGNFPVRNRIIAGLSRGCLVVQAAQKSGARITAQFALEQGREVFAVPGMIDDELSLGCHGLIQEGAKLVGNVEDILIEFLDLEPKKARALVFESFDDTSQQKSIEFQKINNAPKETQNPMLQGVQGELWQACKQACSADDLALKVGLEPEQLHALLFDMQLEGLIEQNFAGLWQRS